ncbi:MAG: hypothetical protein WAO82_03365 [Limnohabitans sp.]
MNSNALSVDFPVGRFFMGLWGVALLCSVTAGAFIFSFVSGDFESWRGALLVVAWSLASLLSFRSVWAGQAKCWLSWNGSAWQILPVRAPSDVRRQEFSAVDLKNHQEADEAGSHLTVHLDLQRVLLVSLANPEGDRNWFWVLQAAFPERWHGFRCAVYSRSE